MENAFFILATIYMIVNLLTMLALLAGLVFIYLKFQELYSFARKQMDMVEEAKERPMNMAKDIGFILARFITSKVKSKYARG